CQPPPSRRITRMTTRTARFAGVTLTALLAVAFAACTVQGIVADSVPMDAAFRVNATLNGTPVRVCVDTGSPTMLVSLATAKRSGFPMRTTATEVADATGV